MIKNLLTGLATAMTLLAAPAGLAADYSQHAEVQRFIDEMVSEHGFERGYLQQQFAQAEKKQSILDAISRPAEKTKPWKDYRKIFVTQKRINQGKEFIEKYRPHLQRAEQEFGVPQQLIAAIIGVETRYGRHKGSYRVVDALSTLAFDYPPRSKFFRKQLKEYFLLVREQGFEPLSVKGSYAGAMGYGQFIPSSYRHYAVDFDGDGVVDIINNPVDAIGSVANYFRIHGWKKGQPVVSPAQVSKQSAADVVVNKLKPQQSIAQYRQQGYQSKAAYADDWMATLLKLDGQAGTEYWLGLKNFYVITRYNHSRLYAMAVYQLSEELN
jgi:membrane-bound lytic murein transglycosylase B